MITEPHAKGKLPEDIYMNLSAAFGPVLREAFPESDPLLRHVVSDSLSEKVREREDWFIQPTEESEAQVDESWSGRLARANSTIAAFEEALGVKADGACPICLGVEGCSHSLKERILATQFFCQGRMTMGWRKLAGATLIAAPFFCAAAFAIAKIGMLPILAIFASAVAVALFVTAGFRLLDWE